MEDNTINYQHCINKQVSLLKEFFHKHINADYVYLDVPGHMNVGDHLIALGAWELLKQRPYKCLKYSTVRGFDWVIPSNAMILLHGGGNFGDLYPGANWFRNEIVKRFPDHKIIFLPQTITYKDNGLIKEDAKICAQHHDLHICARDNESFCILQNCFQSNSVYLLPDTALGLYDTLKKRTKINSSIKSLLIDRRDTEKNGVWDIEADEIMDWPEILDAIRITSRLKLFNVITKLGKRLNSPYLKMVSDSLLIHFIYPSILKRTNRFFLEFDKIYTSRLHGLIFSIMLHLPVEWKDTKYGKISAYARTWLNEE